MEHTRSSIDLTPGLNLWFKTGQNFSRTSDALSELVDNSIQACRGEASANLHLKLYFNRGGDSFALFTDNGCGMNSDGFKRFAMLGVPHAERRRMEEEETGVVLDKRASLSRFGLGGKQAAFCIGSKMRIVSRAKTSDKITELCIDEVDFRQRLEKSGSLAESYKHFITCRSATEDHMVFVPEGDAERQFPELVEDMRAHEESNRNFTYILILLRPETVDALLATDERTHPDNPEKRLKPEGETLVAQLAEAHHFYLYPNHLPHQLHLAFSEKFGLGSATSVGAPASVERTAYRMARGGVGIGGAGAHAFEDNVTLSITRREYTSNKGRRASGGGGGGGAASPVLSDSIQCSVGDTSSWADREVWTIHKDLEQAQGIFRFAAQFDDPENPTEKRHVEAFVLYFPNNGEKETRPERSDDRPAAVFTVYWAGRLIPETQITFLDFMRPSKVPEKIWRRLKGYMFFSGEMPHVSNNKLRLLFKPDPTTWLNGEPSLLYSDRDVAKSFEKWHKSCHSLLDKEYEVSNRDFSIAKIGESISAFSSIRSGHSGAQKLKKNDICKVRAKGGELVFAKISHFEVGQQLSRESSSYAGSGIKVVYRRAPECVYGLSSALEKKSVEHIATVDGHFDLPKAEELSEIENKAAKSVRLVVMEDGGARDSPRDSPRDVPRNGFAVDLGKKYLFGIQLLDHGGKVVLTPPACQSKYSVQLCMLGSPGGQLVKDFGVSKNATFRDSSLAAEVPANRRHTEANREASFHWYTLALSQLDEYRLKVEVFLESCAVQSLPPGEFGIKAFLQPRVELLECWEWARGVRLGGSLPPLKVMFIDSANQRLDLGNQKFDVEIVSSTVKLTHSHRGDRYSGMQTDIGCIEFDKGCWSLDAVLPSSSSGSPSGRSVGLPGSAQLSAKVSLGQSQLGCAPFPFPVVLRPGLPVTLGELSVVGVHECGSTFVLAFACADQWGHRTAPEEGKERWRVTLAPTKLMSSSTGAVDIDSTGCGTMVVELSPQANTGFAWHTFEQYLELDCGVKTLKRFPFEVSINSCFSPMTLSVFRAGELVEEPLAVVVGGSVADLSFGLADRHGAAIPEALLSDFEFEASWAKKTGKKRRRQAMTAGLSLPSIDVGEVAEVLTLSVAVFCRDVPKGLEVAFDVTVLPGAPDRLVAVTGEQIAFGVMSDEAADLARKFLGVVVVDRFGNIVDPASLGSFPSTVPQVERLYEDNYGAGSSCDVAGSPEEVSASSSVGRKRRASVSGGGGRRGSSGSGSGKRSRGVTAVVARDCDVFDVRLCLGSLSLDAVQKMRVWCSSPVAGSGSVRGFVLAPGSVVRARLSGGLCMFPYRVTLGSLESEVLQLVVKTGLPREICIWVGGSDVECASPLSLRLPRMCSCVAVVKFRDGAGNPVAAEPAGLKEFACTLGAQSKTTFESELSFLLPTVPSGASTSPTELQCCASFEYMGERISTKSFAMWLDLQPSNAVVSIDAAFVEWDCCAGGVEAEEVSVLCAREPFPCLQVRFHTDDGEPFAPEVPFLGDMDRGNLQLTVFRTQGGRREAVRWSELFEVVEHSAPAPASGVRMDFAARGSGDGGGDSALPVGRYEFEVQYWERRPGLCACPGDGEAAVAISIVASAVVVVRPGEHCRLELDKASREQLANVCVHASRPKLAKGVVVHCQDEFGNRRPPPADSKTGHRFGATVRAEPSRGAAAEVAPISPRLEGSVWERGEWVLQGEARSDGSSAVFENLALDPSFSGDSGLFRLVFFVDGAEAEPAWAEFQFTTNLELNTLMASLSSEIRTLSAEIKEIESPIEERRQQLRVILSELQSMEPCGEAGDGDVAEHRRCALAQASPPRLPRLEEIQRLLGQLRAKESCHAAACIRPPTLNGSVGVLVDGRKRVCELGFVGDLDLARLLSWFASQHMDAVVVDRWVDAQGMLCKHCALDRTPRFRHSPTAESPRVRTQQEMNVRQLPLQATGGGRSDAAVPGFLGFLVNAIELRREDEHLRDSLFFAIFKDSMLFDSMEHALAYREGLVPQSTGSPRGLRALSHFPAMVCRSGRRKGSNVGAEGPCLIREDGFVDPCLPALSALGWVFGELPPDRTALATDLRILSTLEAAAKIGEDVAMLEEHNLGVVADKRKALENKQAESRHVQAELGAAAAAGYRKGRGGGGGGSGDGQPSRQRQRK